MTPQGLGARTYAQRVRALLPMPVSAVVGRALLVLTTSGSAGHWSALSCHAAHWPHNPLAHHADVLLYSTRSLSSEFVSRFERVYANNHVGTVVITPPEGADQNEQVIDTFVQALHPPALARYDWVIVSNLDVVMVNATRFVSMLANPETWAVLANCNPDRRCVTECTRAVVHSDFFAFRPREVRFRNQTGVAHAETYARRMFMAAITLGHDAWIQARGFQDRSCRIRAGVRSGRPEVVHYHHKTSTC